MLCGMLSGSHWGPNIRKWMSATSDADLGQAFLAIDPEAYAPGFNARLQDFMDTLRGLPHVSAIVFPKTLSEVFWLHGV
ncbi:hypothetical protein COOONC_18081 [Cooperia oncophora]